MFFIGRPIEFHVRGDVIDDQIIFDDTTVQLKLWRNNGPREPVDLLVKDVRRSMPMEILPVQQHALATQANPQWFSLRDAGELGDVRLVELRFAGREFSTRVAQSNLEAGDRVLFEAFQDQGIIELRVSDASTNESAGLLLELDYGKLDDC